MRATLRASIYLVASTALITLSGCEAPPPAAATSNTEVTVKGVVKVDATLASDGDVVFDPSNYQRQGVPRKAPIGKDGSYSIKTLVGQNTIKLGGELARKYQNLQHKQQVYEVQNGDNTHDLEFSSK